MENKDYRPSNADKFTFRKLLKVAPVVASLATTPVGLALAAENPSATTPDQRCATSQVEPSGISARDLLNGAIIFLEGMGVGAALTILARPTAELIKMKWKGE